MANDVINIVTILGDSIDVQEVMKVLVKNKRVTFKDIAPTDDIRVYYTTLLDKNKVRFFTDDNCPYEAINILSELFPSVKIRLQWADEDLGYNVGEITIKNGDVIDSKAPKGGSDEAYAMAMVITEDKFYITDFLYSIEEDEMDEEFPSMCIRLAFQFRVLDEMFPSFILAKFEELAVNVEDYEFASEVTKILK